MTVLGAFYRGSGNLNTTIQLTIFDKRNVTLKIKLKPLLLYEKAYYKIEDES